MMMFERLPEDGSDGGYVFGREPIIEPVFDAPMPVIGIEPVSVFETTIAQPTVSVPEPVVSDPANWEVAATAIEPVEYESSLPWHSVPEPSPVESPKYVFNEDTSTYPIELQPAYTYQDPAPIEVPMLYQKEDPVCNCIAYPCNCDETPVRGIDSMPQYPLTYEDKYPTVVNTPPYNPTPTYDVPPPIVTAPIVTPAPVLPVDIPVQTLPPVVNVTVQTQTPTTQQAAAPAGANADGETAMLFGYPWYYVAGAAAAGLFLLSSMDGKK